MNSKYGGDLKEHLQSLQGERLAAAEATKQQVRWLYYNNLIMIGIVGAYI